MRYSAGASASFGRKSRGSQANGAIPYSKRSNLRSADKIYGGTKMSLLMKIVIVILILLLIALAALYYFGSKMQKRQREQQGQMEAIAQTVSILVIDKKRMKITESGLPQIVIDQTPKYMRWSKLPIVKAKIGPKIMTLVADEKVFQVIPVKKECKVVVSGIYITAIKSARGGLEQAPEKKKGFFARFKKK